MSKNLSVLVAIATLGSGLVLLAIGAGAPLPLLVVFVAIGVAELAWAVATLRTDRVPAPRIFLGVVLVPLAVWAASLALGAAASLPIGPLAAASALGVSVAAIVVVTQRRSREAGTRAGPPATGAVVDPAVDPTAEHPWRFIGTLAASAAIVAGIVTPALSGTWAGQYAVPHGSHEVPGLEIDEHGGH
ncbi:hypothetical protein [Labedella endophytica]|uniref:Uncharacterized protein n=1 Tax=Labedella endophytica TaxID=1523160 RepID=A0A433JVT1_9MICO|nr:hypothetical protein [Labedella endophytica]RUR03250.1 hypothetical protein ELQ94_01470 [Labedella endophytica]